MCQKLSESKNKELVNITSSFKYLVAGGGLEPPTFGLWAQRAANCSTPRCATRIIIQLRVSVVNIYKLIYLYYMQKLVKYYMEYINKIGILGPSPNPYMELYYQELPPPPPEPPPENPPPEEPPEPELEGLDVIEVFTLVIVLFIKVPKEWTENAVLE